MTNEIARQIERLSNRFDRVEDELKQQSHVVTGLSVKVKRTEKDTEAQGSQIDSLAIQLTSALTQLQIMGPKTKSFSPSKISYIPTLVKKIPPLIMGLLVGAASIGAVLYKAFM
jgi:hypothetical protein